MSYFSLPILLLSIMLSILSRTSPSYGGAVYVYHFCANTTIPKNSSYKSSLSSLFSSFSSYANHNVEFFSPSSSSLTSSLSSNAISKIQISLNISDPVYGLHICRGDVTAEVCRECVEEAAKDLANRCSRELVAVIWYDECMMPYWIRPSKSNSIGKWTWRWQTWQVRPRKFQRVLISLGWIKWISPSFKRCIA